MATLGSVRRSFVASLNLMRCMVLGSRHLRSCHNDTKDTGSNSDAISEEKDAENVVNEESDNYSDDDDEGIDDGSISDRILTAALQFVPEYGWTAEAIAEGARAEGFSGMAEGMFPREGGDLVLHFIDTCNLNLGDYLADNSRTEEENRKIGQTDFIKDALEVRLKMTIPYIKSWPQAMGLMLYPSNASDALQSVANMTDDIWYHSNDSSTDINWYIKRSSLAAIYGLTELYMVNDQSHDLEETWRFLDQRFQDIKNTSNIKNSVDKAGKDISRLACSAMILVRNVSGFSKWDR